MSVRDDAEQPSLSLAQLRSILADLARAAPAEGLPAPSAVRAVLRRHGSSDLPFEVGMALVDTVAGLGEGQGADSIPLKRLEELLQRIH